MRQLMTAFMKALIFLDWSLALANGLVGRPFPEFKLSDERGNDVSLQSYPDKRLLLWWYPKADTPG